MVGMLQVFFIAVSQECMSSLLVMIKPFWIEFSEPKTESFRFLSPTEETDVVVNSIYNDVWESKYERTGALNENFERCY